MARCGYYLGARPYGGRCRPGVVLACSGGRRRPGVGRLKAVAMAW